MSSNYILKSFADCVFSKRETNKTRETSRGSFLSLGKENGERDCLFKHRPSTILLGLSSGLFGAYPLFLRVSLILFRLTQ